MSQVIIAGDTSGTITLQAPAVSGSTTLTLPATTATLATLTTPSFASTIGVGAATASASGSGITFPATQSASSDANTLDDYEEGTWTPSLNFAGGTTGMTYASFGQVGTYVKVGKNVTVTVWLQLATKGSSTGIAYINNLPFTSQANTNGYAGAAIAHWGGISTVTWVALYLTPSSTQLIFSGGIPPSGTNSALTNSNITDGTYILNTFTYIAAA